MSALLTVADMVAAQARLQPDKIGARDSRRTLSFRQWDRRASRLTNALLGLGLAKGDRVALLAYNCVEWMELYAALARGGLVAVPINFRLVGPEIHYIAQHCEARAFVVQDDLVEGVMSIRDQLGLPSECFVHFGDVAAPTGWSSYETLIERASASDPAVDVHPEDIWALLYTSGTTGRPKGAIRSHGASAVMSLVTAVDMGFTHHDTALLVMPMCHANSLYFSFAFTYIGATCVIDDQKSFDPERLLRTLSEQSVSFTSLVPTHYIMMLGLPDDTKRKYDVSSVSKSATCSSTPAAPSCCSRSSRNAKKRRPSPSPAICRSASGARSPRASPRRRHRRPGHVQRPHHRDRHPQLPAPHHHRPHTQEERVNVEVPAVITHRW